MTLIKSSTNILFLDQKSELGFWLFWNVKENFQIVGKNKIPYYSLIVLTLLSL
jgi:hypothetical protein